MYSLVLLAAGTGSRMKLGYNKMIHQINGQPIIKRTLDKFIDHERINEIVLVVNEQDHDYLQTILPVNKKLKVLCGGAERQDSVFEGIKYLQQHSANKYVLIHDGARCHISQKLIDKCLQEVDHSQLDGYAVGVHPKDSIREVHNGQITKVLDRDHLYAMQTPQIAKIALLYQCLKTSSEKYTDEVGLLLANNYPVQIIDGEYSNFKITTREDLGGNNE